jgi:hypothetical protein
MTLRKAITQRTQPPPVPDDLSGWRWIRHEGSAEIALQSPDGKYATKWYLRDFDRAASEARAWMAGQGALAATAAKLLDGSLPLPDDLAGWVWDAGDQGVRLVSVARRVSTPWAAPANAARLIGDARGIIAAEDAAPTEEAKAHTLLISDIRRDGGTQARVGNNEETVESYAEAMRDGRWAWGSSNAVIVYVDAEWVYWLADGFHRVEAAQRAGLATVLADVREGTRRDAVLYAAGANAEHGLRRTRADIRQAIAVLLRDEEWRQWSDREIAKHSRCDHKTVGSVRTDLIATGEIPQSTTRIGADGRTTTPPSYSEVARQRQQRQAIRDARFDAVPPPASAPADVEIRQEIAALEARQSAGMFSAADAAALAKLDDALEALAEDLDDAEYESLARRISDLAEDAPTAYVCPVCGEDAPAPTGDADMCDRCAGMAVPAAPAAFPPGNVEAGIGAIQARLSDGEHELPGDLDWARTLRAQLDAARDGMEPAAYQRWSERLDVATESLVRLSPPDDARPAPAEAPARTTDYHAALKVAGYDVPSLTALRALIAEDSSLDDTMRGPFVSAINWRIQQMRPRVEAVEEAEVIEEITEEAKKAEDDAYDIVWSLTYERRRKLLRAMGGRPDGADDQTVTDDLVVRIEEGLRRAEALDTHFGKAA